MRVKVDEDLCVGTGNCVQDCPEVFELEGGISKVIADPVPGDVEDKARQAVEDCPMEAITIEE
jgi:ferredoxin